MQVSIQRKKTVEISLDGFDKENYKKKKKKVYEMKKEFATLLSISSVTSKTFIASKVFIFRKSGWFCLKAHNLPLFHAKFCHAGSSGLSSTCF